MQKPTLYLSGPITGWPDAPARFAQAAAHYRAQGYPVINPCEIVPPDADWDTAMRICLEALRSADQLIRLSGWSRSRGASREVAQMLLWGRPVEDAPAEW